MSASLFPTFEQIDVLEDVFDNLVHVALPDLRELDGDHEEGEAARQVLPAADQVVGETQVPEVGKQTIWTAIAWYGMIKNQIFESRKNDM